MTTKRRVLAGSLILALALAVFGLLALPRQAEARCWDYMARYDAYWDRCMIADPQDCMVVT